MEEKREIGVNQSSGAEKVERIEKEIQAEKRNAEARIVRAQKRVEQKKARKRS